MNEFIKILLSLSVSGALLLLLLLGLKPFYKDRFSKRWQYYIWIIVALRFLLPFTPDTAIVGSLFEKFDTAATTNEIPASPNVPVSANPDNSEAEPIQPDRNITVSVVTHEPFNKYVCLLFVWSALALILFVRKVTVYQGFIRYIKAGNKEVSDIKILNLLSDCEEKLNIRTRVELSCNPLIASPMLVGFFRPGIVLPARKLEEKELSYIFVHELIHYRQRDMFYKWLIQIVVCVHWFNPFVYLLEKEVNNSCELSCDEKVISVLDDTARREYGDTLISFLKSNNPYKSSSASVTLTEGVEQLKERLGAIMKFKKKSKAMIAITAIFTVAVCVCFFVTGAYAAPVNDSESLYISENQVAAPNPDLTIHIDNAPVLIENKNTNIISASYNSRNYDVSINQSLEGEWNVDISVVHSNTNKSVILYIPNVEYNSVKIEIDNGMYSGGIFNAKNIIADVDNGGLDFSLSKNFDGSVKVDAYNSVFHLVSLENYKNFDIEIISDSESLCDVPGYFDCINEKYTYVNGTGRNLMNISLQGGSVGSLEKEIAMEAAADIYGSAESDNKNSVFEMELDRYYDDTEPFVNEKLFCVSEDISTLKAKISFQMEGKSGIVEIRDNETDELIWANTWNENIENDTFTISLNDILKENEYVIRFVGAEINYAKIEVAFESDLVQERVRPRKSN